MSIFKDIMLCRVDCWCPGKAWLLMCHVWT